MQFKQDQKYNRYDSMVTMVMNETFAVIKANDSYSLSYQKSRDAIASKGRPQLKKSIKFQLLAKIF